MVYNFLEMSFPGFGGGVVLAAQHECFDVLEKFEKEQC
jgi:hypothetical protein